MPSGACGCAPSARRMVPAAAALLLCVWLVIAALTAVGARAAAPVQPYATNDAGGFRNVLPSGENGTDNARQLAEFELNGTYPPHYTDQLPLYANLLHGSPTLTQTTSPTPATTPATRSRPGCRWKAPGWKGC